jgi:non-canonical purine NTP pyrophosphatase (RdgB/HAM1 family)
MKFSKILFASTNQGKIREVQEILDIPIEGIGLEIPEIQSLDENQVAIAKAQAYFSRINQPLLVEDTSLRFKSLGGLPGPYINDFSKALGNEGLIKILDSFTDRSAIAITTLAFITRPDKCHTFTGETKGNIATLVSGTGGFGWDPIFIPEGFTKTFAEISPEEKNRISMRKIALTKLKQFLSS